VICIQKVEDLVELVQQRGRPVRVVCAAPEDSESLEALCLARDAGIAVPCAVGRQPAIVTVARVLGIDLRGFEFVDVSDPEAVAPAAAAMVHEGRAEVLMKGCLQTKSVIRAALDQQAGLRGERMLSHLALFDAPALGKPVVVTDAGVNIRPNLSQKVEIIKNAAEVVRRLGVRRPKIAMLAAVEHVNVSSMPATLDARLIERMAEAGMLGEIDLQGPLALDDAVSPEVVRTKALIGPVVGQADVLVAPEIETANVLYKALTCFAGLEGASIVWGGLAPIVVPGRADSARTKFLSIALAAALVEENV
jgi:phosphate butyryltransferase